MTAQKSQAIAGAYSQLRTLDYVGLFADGQTERRAVNPARADALTRLSAFDRLVR
jgi:hypothetical protein